MRLSLDLGLGSVVLNQGGGAATGSEYLIIIALHQSNMTGGQTNALGAALVSPADDAEADIYEWSPNGGGAYASGGADPTPSFARMLNAQATAQLRYPQGTGGETTYPRSGFSVGPAWSFAKAVKAANPTKKVVIIPAGVGGTSMSEWGPGSGTSTNWPANRYTVTKTAYDTFKAAYPNSEIYAFISSFLENEIQNATGLASVTDSPFVENFRLFNGASSAPFIFSSPLPEWMTNSPTRMAYLLEGAKWAATKPNVGFTRRRRGYSVGGDTIHMTNVGNRIHGPEMHDVRARLLAQNAAPIAAPSVTLEGETLVITSNGAPYYEIWTRSAGSGGAYTKYEFVPLEYNAPGEVFRVTIPGSGDRDAYVVAKAYGGDGTTAVFNYVIPNPTMPTPVVELDFDNATVDGSDNFTSVPSTGSNTSAWTPTASAGTGATASLKRTLIGSKYAAITDASTKCFHLAGFTMPAGDYTIVTPMLYSTSQSAGSLFGSGQSGSSHDILFSVRGSGQEIGVFNNSTSTVQVTTSGSVTRRIELLWCFLAVTYDRTANLAKIYLNDEIIVQGTPTLRSASPSNSGGSKFFNNGIQSATSGWTGANTRALPPKAYNAVLTADQLQKLKAQYTIDHGINFGIVPLAS